MNLNVWPQTPLRELDGKCPAEVAADPAFRVRLLAAILLLEIGRRADPQGQFDYNELRAKLGLPLRRRISTRPARRVQLSCRPAAAGCPPNSWRTRPLIQLLSAGLHVPRVAGHRGGWAWSRGAGRACKARWTRDQIYALGPAARDADEALEFNASGRQAAEAAGRHPPSGCWESCNCGC